MKKFLFLGIGFMLFLSACFVLPVEDPIVPPPIVQMPEARALRTVPVMRGDVAMHISPTASYLPAREEQFMFSLGGYRIQGIYVSIGDYVQEGDVLASLYVPHIQNRLAQRLRQLEWLELELSQITRRISWNPGNNDYTSRRNVLRQEIDLLEFEIGYLERENDRRYLRSTMDGVVTATAIFEEGMTSSTLQVIATVVDQGFNVFVVRSVIAQPVMYIGDYFVLSLHRIPHLAVVIDPDEFGIDRGRDDEVYLILVDETLGIPASVGNVHVVLDVVEDVLYIPPRAIHRASDRIFVYVLNEQGIRVLRDVELGMRGNAAYEIISGLSEGELVILG